MNAIMDDERPLFILAGNGPYDNRGCEAIVRGSTKILRAFFEDPRFVCISHFQNDQQFRNQSIQETDSAITHLQSHLLKKKEVIREFWKPETRSYVYNYLLNKTSLNSPLIYRDLLPYLDGAAAVLSVGGDNYSLDYGVPKLFTALDDFVLQKKKAFVIWGASVGPFDKIPEYERYMGQHLSKIPGIFARESITINYLKHIGVSENVCSVADPAFVMDPVKPEGIDDFLSIDDESIGINMSPIMAKYVTNCDLDTWISIVARVIESVSEKTELPIYLIPHVTNPDSNDHEFMLQAFSCIKNKNIPITLIPPVYSAAEIKWIISQMALFAGARTHATIAALSSCVPTLSFTYSIKAQGINQDIFDHDDFCIRPMDLNAGGVADHLVSLLDNKAAIRATLKDRIPQIQKKALNAGIELKHIIGLN